MKITCNPTWKFSRDGMAFTLSLDDIAQLLLSLVCDNRLRVYDEESQSVSKGIGELLVSVENDGIQLCRRHHVVARSRSRGNRE